MNKASRLRAIDQQIARLTGELAQLRKQSGRLGWLRVASFGLLILGSAAGLYAGGAWLAATLFILLTLLFIVMITIHRRIEEAITKRVLWRRWKQTQVARAMLDWSTIPLATEVQPDYAHPFEADLDVVAERAEEISLHRLLDISTTLGGSRRLREWLSATDVDVDAVLSRQELVRELMPRSRLRSRLFVEAKWAQASADAADAEAVAASKLETDSLLNWLATKRPDDHLRRWITGLSALLLVSWVLLVLNLLGLIGSWWWLSLALYWALLMGSLRNAGSLFQEAATLRDQLNHFVHTFRLLENFSYRDTPHLRDLCAPFLHSERRPSRYLNRVSTVVNATAVRGNPLIWFVLNTLTPWDHLFAHRLRVLKEGLAEQMPRWLDIWFELEALMALANYGYLNPHATFPEFSPADASQADAPQADAPQADAPQDFDGAVPVFDAQQLGHPLLPDQRTVAGGEPVDVKVRNDFRLQQLGNIALVTGSNMSGKSTFLRTVGANLVLANAGGPVDALKLHTAPFRLFTSIKVSDSVADGVSYFYAEVRRLRSLLTALETAHPQPLFFLIDEIFRGTNNRERLIGSQSFVKGLAGRSGVGLISTHDLELVTLAEILPEVSNFHFRDEILKGRMRFDYLLRRGSAHTTNALAIMRQEGLPVEDKV